MTTSNNTTLVEGTIVAVDMYQPGLGELERTVVVMKDINGNESKFYGNTGLPNSQAKYAQDIITRLLTPLEMESLQAEAETKGITLLQALRVAIVEEKLTTILAGRKIQIGHKLQFNDKGLPIKDRKGNQYGDYTPYGYPVKISGSDLLAMDKRRADRAEASEPKDNY